MQVYTGRSALMEGVKTNIRCVLAHPDQRFVTVRSVGPFWRLELQVVVHELHLPLHKAMDSSKASIRLLLPRQVLIFQKLI